MMLLKLNSATVLCGGEILKVAACNVKRTLGVLLLFVFITPMFGWGGHKPVNRVGVEALPKELSHFFAKEKEWIIRHCHIPDLVKPFDYFKEIPEEDIRFLKKYGLKNTFHFHRPKGQALCFILLTKAFKENDSKRAAFYAATLFHAISDESAYNHSPLLHFLCFAIMDGYKMRVGNGMDSRQMYFTTVSQSNESKALVKKLMKDWKPSILSEDPQEAIRKVMLIGVESNAFLTRRELKIAASYALDAVDAGKLERATGITELAVYGAQQTLNIIWTAWVLAQKGVLPELTEQDFKTYEMAKAEYIRKRPLEDDSIYLDMLKHVSDGKTAAVGLLVEPSMYMAKTRLTFSAKYIMAATACSLRKMNIPYRVVDLRTVRKGLPSPKEMPLLIVCGGGFRGPESFKDYAEAGGKFLWIGGRHGGQLGKLSQCLKEISDTSLPVSKKYGRNNTEIVKKAKVNFAGSFAKMLDDRKYGFTHNPETAAGWQKPRCFLVVEPCDPNVQVVAHLMVDEQKFNIAGALMEEIGGQARHIFLPEYLVSPYLFSEDSFDDPSKPTLDSFGSRLLWASLQMLTPQLVLQHVSE